MKIAYIALKDLPYIGGLEKYTEEIGSRLVLDGHEVDVYVTAQIPGKKKTFKGINIISTKTVKIKGFERFFVQNMAVLKATLSSAQIIHFHGFENSLLTIIPKLLGKKIVLQGHGLEWERDRWGKLVKCYLRFMSFTINSFKPIFFHNAMVVSKVQRDYYKKRYKREYDVIPTGINPSTKADPNLILSDNIIPGKYILFAARLVKEKGCHYLIEAFKKLNYKNIQLVIAGDAPEEIHYKQELRDLANGYENIKFIGSANKEKMDELYSNALMFILPSTLEGLAISLLEAMSFGIPTLSSNIPPNCEATENGLYGFHFKNRSILDLKEKMKEIIDNYENSKNKGLRAAKFVEENYNWNEIYQKILLFYKKLLK